MHLTSEQYAAFDQRNTIELVATPYLIAEPDLFAATLQRAAHYLSQHGNTVTIGGNPRAESGWLEFTMHVKYASGCGMVIGCIQRQPGADYEFHS